MVKRIKKALFVLKKNPMRVLVYIIDNKLFNWLPDDLYLKIVYYFRIGKKLDLKNPITFNEKLQWLKLYDHKPIYTKMADKYAAREYISEKIGEEYLIPLIGVYERFDDINFDKLPSQFVLKCTHDSGGVIICDDKEKLNIKKARSRLNNNLKQNFYFRGREWPYKNIKPQIICEKFMLDESGYELKDYKILCFNGKAKCLFVCLNRNLKTGLNVDFYDIEWNPLPFERHYSSSGSLIPRPHNFEKMIKLAEKLAVDIPFVRVDFYEVDGKIYFGELTFFPGSGFEKFNPKSYDEVLGNWIDLKV